MEPETDEPTARGEAVCDCSSGPKVHDPGCAVYHIKPADCTTVRRTPAVEVVSDPVANEVAVGPHADYDSPLYEDIRSAINRHSRENVSDTPDFVLAGFLTDALRAFDVGVTRRCHFYGRYDTPGGVVTPINAPAHDSGATVNGTFSTETRGDYATAPVYKCNSKECGGLSLESGLFEGLCACGASVTEVRDVSKDQYRRMCAQAATIAAQADQILRMTGEVARLRDLMLEALASKEAQCALHETERRAMVERDDEARAEVERLETKHTQLLIDVGLIERERDGAILDRDAARARIAALEAVVTAQDRALSAMREHALATVALCAAYSDAELKFGRRVAGARITEDK